MKPGKQTNKGYKCPNCKKFGLRPQHYLYSYIQPEPKFGHVYYSGLGYNYYECRNCYAIFEAVEEN